MTHWDGVQIFTTRRGVVVVTIATTTDFFTIEWEGFTFFVRDDPHLLHVPRFILFDRRTSIFRRASHVFPSTPNWYHHWDFYLDWEWDFDDHWIVPHVSHDEYEYDECYPK